MHDSQPEQRRDDVVRRLTAMHSRTFAFVLSLVRDFQFAEEVVQEVAVVVLRQWDDFTPGTNFGAWVRQIARNKVYQMSRAARRQILLTDEAIDRIETTAAQETGGSMREALRHCLDGLAVRAREIISMRYRGDQNCTRIAERFGMTAAAVHMALSRARAALERCIRSRLADGSANS